MNVRIAQLLSFTAGAWYDDALEMNQYTVKLWMITQTENTLEQTIAFSRMKHFVYTQLDSTIFVDSSHVKAEEFTRSGLNVTTMPGDPADQLIGIMLFHKLNAVMEGRIAVVEVEISAADAVVYLHGENETSESLQQPSWWHSADLDHSDISDDPDNVVSLHPEAAWRDVGLAWPTEETAIDSATGNVVSFADIKNDAE
jgi:hypothetical protein